MFEGLATSGNYSQSIRDQPPHLIEGVVGMVFSRRASFNTVFGIDGVDCRVTYRVKTDDCFHDHNPVMIIMMIMMVVTMEKTSSMVAIIMNKILFVIMFVMPDNDYVSFYALRYEV